MIECKFSNMHVDLRATQQVSIDCTLPLEVATYENLIS